MSEFKFLHLTTLRIRGILGNLLPSSSQHLNDLQMFFCGHDDHNIIIIPKSCYTNIENRLCSYEIRF